MFRRRTDQVYSTLQQVQRRITEQTGGGQHQLDELRPVAAIPAWAETLTLSLAIRRAS